MKLQVFLCLLATSAILHAQELKKVTKSNNHFGEIYFVLKTNRNIKHGQYLKYSESMNLHDKSVEAYGSYDNNKRTGAWIFCDVVDESNPLISIGEYKDDKKVGQWVYFYRLISENENIINLSGSNKHTKVILPSKENNEFIITLDTSGIKTAVVGDYLDNKKTGIWNYYYRNGSLACKYDFSANLLIYENGLKSFDQLGGIEWFRPIFHKSSFEERIINQPFIAQNSNVVFELATFHDSIDLKKIISTGSESFVKTMENILNKMSLDWINYDPRLEQNKIFIQINYIVNGNIGTVTIDSIKPLLNN